MKLLFDQNLSPFLVEALNDLYPESAHIMETGLDTSSDAEVRAYAGSQGFTIVTKDADFGELCTLLGFPPKILWLRVQGIVQHASSKDCCDTTTTGSSHSRVTIQSASSPSSDRLHIDDD